MNKLSSRFTFKPAEKFQQNLIHSWLAQPYIHEWIHGQGLQSTLNGLQKFFHYRAQGKELDRQTDITQHWIGYDGDIPFVYLLTSNLFKNIPNEYTSYAETDGPMITLDIFIGDTNYLGKGLASTVIKEFLLNHFSDISEVFIDPEQSNQRALHVYQKVGFKIVGEFIAAWHPVPHYIMKMTMKDLLTS